MLGPGIVTGWDRQRSRRGSGSWRMSGSRRGWPSGTMPHRSWISRSNQCAAGTRGVTAGYESPVSRARKRTIEQSPRTIAHSSRASSDFAGDEQHHQPPAQCARARRRGRPASQRRSSSAITGALRSRPRRCAAAGRAALGSTARAPTRRPGSPASPTAISGCSRPRHARTIGAARAPGRDHHAVKRLVDPDERDIGEHDQQAGERELTSARSRP